MPRRPQQKQFSFRRHEVFSERMPVANLHPDTRMAFDECRRRISAADAIDGPQQRIVRRPNDAQESAIALSCLQPAVGNAVIAQAQNLQCQARQTCAGSKIEQNGSLLQPLHRKGIGAQRQYFRPAGDRHALPLAGARRDDAQFAQLGERTASQCRFRFDPYRPGVADDGARGGLADSRRNCTADQGQSECFEIRKLQNHNPPTLPDPAPSYPLVARRHWEETGSGYLPRAARRPCPPRRL